MFQFLCAYAKGDKHEFEGAHQIWATVDRPKDVRAERRKVFLMRDAVEGVQSIKAGEKRPMINFGKKKRVFNRKVLCELTTTGELKVYLENFPQPLNQGEHSAVCKAYADLCSAASL